MSDVAALSWKFTSKEVNARAVGLAAIDKEIAARRGQNLRFIDAGHLEGLRMARSVAALGSRSPLSDIAVTLLHLAMITEAADEERGKGRTLGIQQAIVLLMRNATGEDLGKQP